VMSPTTPMGRRLFGHVVPSELRSKWAMSYRRPSVAA
jgi:hypothetical protein